MDRYTTQARFRPAIIVFIPLISTLAGLFPDEIISWESLIAVMGYLGISSLLAHLARDFGKWREPKLFRDLGGKPTTMILRHTGTRLDRITLSRYHRKLSELLKTSIPSVDEEKKQPLNANEVYESCTRWLRNATRDKRKYPLVFEESMNYGFRRNLWAMKPGALALCVIGILTLWGILMNSEKIGIGITPIPIIGLLVNIILLSWWLVRITPKWVQLTADAYAERLMEALDTL